MRTFTSCVVVGCITRDVEVKFSKGGDPYCEIKIAIDKYKSETPIWGKIKVFGETAKWMGGGLKGDNIIGSNLQFDVEEWEKEGVKQRTHSFKASKVSNLTIIKKGSTRFPDERDDPDKAHGNMDESKLPPEEDTSDNLPF